MRTKKAIWLFAPLLCMHMVMAQTAGLTKNEINKGWRSLFDGKSLDGWQKANGQPFNGKGWTVKDGVLSTDTASGHGGDIVTTTEFGDFELSLEFKLAPGTNSGIKYALFKNSSLGCEYQLIDDARHADAKLGKNGNRTLGALYDILPPSDKKVKPVGEWNTVRIVKKGTHAEHWLNGKMVLSYDRTSEAFKKAVAESKFKKENGFGETSPSPILLQEHGDIIHYRNIKIKNL
jgi:3-keto-disaccharide hydrolase